MLGNQYNGYEKSLLRLDLEKLSERRKQLCINFSPKCANNPKIKHMFPENEKRQDMKTRLAQKYKIEHANTERLKKSSLIYMQHLLNEDEGYK